MVNVGKWIENWARIHPQKVAVIAEGIPYTYSQLDKQINRIGRFFLDKGAKKGDRIAVLLKNSREYIEVFFAISKIGCIMVPLNWRLTLPELEFIIADSSTTGIVFDRAFLNGARLLREKIPAKIVMMCNSTRVEDDTAIPKWISDYEKVIPRYPDESPEPPWRVRGDDPHVLMYTSGTTGSPKGAILPHRKTFFNVLNAEIFFDLTQHDIALIPRPMFHSGGLIVEMAPLFYKGGTVIVKNRFSPREILETIERYRVTVLELPATVYQFILNDCDPGQYDLSSLKCCFTGGERVSLSLIATYNEKGIVISQIYGLTEASTIFYLPAEMALEKMGSVGIPVFHGSVRIVNSRGKQVAPTEIGEIIVRGPIVMSGYWNKPDLTRSAIRKGWLHTGDLARIDGDGFAYIVDRKKDMFISGGENVYPAEIENALLTHPAILDAAVIAVWDEKWGEAGKAFIVPREDSRLSSADVYEFLQDKLAKYKIPAHIEFTKKLPKTASGKIRKSLLKKS